jgi:hypothetical protein
MEDSRRPKEPRGDRFRITTERRPGRVVVRAEGWLTPASLAIVEAACGEARDRGEAVAIDLSGVRSLPGAGAQRLAELSRTGVELVGASGFVAALLRERESG